MMTTPPESRIPATDLYTADSSGDFYSPFRAECVPIKNLLLVDFTGDSVYCGLEYQLFDLEPRGRLDVRTDKGAQPAL